MRICIIVGIIILLLVIIIPSGKLESRKPETCVAKAFLVIAAKHH